MSLPDSSSSPSTPTPLLDPSMDPADALAEWFHVLEIDSMTLPFRLGRFLLLDRIGQGGMGRVFHARDTHLNRDVALKTLRSHISRSTTAREQFIREARALAQFNSPRIVAIYSAEEVQGVTCLVMPLLRGENLGRLLERGKLPPNEADRVARELALALSDIHRLGLVHRDVKPSNVWLEPDGRVLLMDLGVTMAEEIQPNPRAAISGTPSYMSPEQAAGRLLDTRSDLFSLGSVYVEMLSGQRLFPGHSTLSALNKITRQPIPPRMRSLGLSRSRRAVVLKLLAVSPSNRYPDADEVASAIRRVSRWRWTVRASLVGPLLMAGLWTSWPESFEVESPLSIVEPESDEFPPLDLDWCDKLASVSRKGQVDMLRAELVRRNPGFSSKIVWETWDDDRCVKFRTVTSDLVDLMPLRAVPGLRDVEVVAPSRGERGRLESLEPLRGMDLCQVGFSNNPIVDLTPLNGMPIHSAWLGDIATTDFSPLRGMPLTVLHATSVVGKGPPLDLLLTFKLKDIWIDHTQMPDIEGLRQLSSLKMINGVKADLFWKTYYPKQ